MEALILIAIIAMLVWFVLRSKGKTSATNAAKAGAPVGSRPDLSMLPAQFVVFDLETTGLHAARHHIIEIGAIRVNRDTDVHDTFSTLVKPRQRIGAKITELTGLDRDALLADGLDVGEALAEFRKFVGDLPMVAFNANFDVSFLNAECERDGSPAFANRIGCALNLARTAWPRRTSYRLSHICADAGIVLASEHRALPDCERAMRVYVAASQQLGRCNIPYK